MKKVFSIAVFAFILSFCLLNTACEDESVAQQEELYIDSPDGEEYEDPDRGNG